MNPNEQDFQDEITQEPVEQPIEEVASAQDEPQLSKAEQKAAKAEEKTKKDKRNNLMYVIIAVVFVIAGIAALVWNSGVVEENTTAITMNGQDYSVAEVNFYMVNSYQTFVSNYYDYISYFGLDTSVSLKSQTSMDGTSTWYDYFLEEGIYQMTTVVALLEEAQAVGYVFDESVEQSKAAYLAEIELYAPYYGFSGTEEYLQTIYGATMTVEIYEKLLLQALQAEAYSYAFEESLVYDEATLTAAYEADPNTYDMVDYESLYVYNPVATTDDEGNTIEVTDEMTAAALEEAAALTDQLYQDFSAGASMSDVADTSDLATYLGETTTTYYDGDAVCEWLFDTSRKAGDTAVLEDPTYGTYYVVLFNQRYREDYNLVNVRHILITPDVGTLTSEDEGYDEEIAALSTAALASAQTVYDEFLAGDQSEDSFATLATTYSADTGSTATGGLYESVAKGDMVEAFENWCFEDGRQVGDTGIVETEYGYHIMYFSGYGLPYWQALVEVNLLQADYETWFYALQESVVVERNELGMSFVGATM